jgi:hypothetical protein
MALELTPRTWPAANRGLTDDAAEAVRAAGRAGQARGLLARLALRLTPWGCVVARLKRGQTVTLHGPSQARVECLEGLAWVTCPSDGRDVTLKPGQAVRLPGSGLIAVSAMHGPARVRLGWK